MRKTWCSYMWPFHIIYNKRILIFLPDVNDGTVDVIDTALVDVVSSVSAE